VVYCDQRNEISGPEQNVCNVLLFMNCGKKEDILSIFYSKFSLNFNEVTVCRMWRHFGGNRLPKLRKRAKLLLNVS